MNASEGDFSAELASWTMIVWDSTMDQFVAQASSL